MQIDGTTKASVMNYASETSLGVVTIRAFNMADDKFFENYLKLTDTDAKLFFYSNATLEWSILRVETLQNITLFTAAFLLVLIPKGYVAPGLLGLSFSNALALTVTQVFMTRWHSSFCNYIISMVILRQLWRTKTTIFMAFQREGSVTRSEDKIPVECSIGSQGHHLHFHRRDQSRNCWKDWKWQNYTHMCFVSSSRTR
ncbi:hypothetical protein CsSME_00052143 [Camellia sinensis var. sinensis]